jgi:hypothetical protein
MRSRTLFVALAGLAVVVVARIVVLWLEPPSRITLKNYGLIQVGMSRSEVEAILGPPGDYTTSPTDPDPTWHSLPLAGKPPVDGARITAWRCDTGDINLAFDRQEKVDWGQFSARIRPRGRD